MGRKKSNSGCAKKITTYTEKNGALFPHILNTINSVAAFGTREFVNLKNILSSAEIFEDRLRNNRLNFKSAVYLDQTHSGNINILKSLGSNRKVLSDTDGVITSLRKIVLTVRSADCVPILMFNPQKTIIGASHQGWKGVLLRLPQKMVEETLKNGGKIEDLKIAIGPSIGYCCYDVSEERMNLFKNAFPNYPFESNRLNLPHLSYVQLIEMGLKKENIFFFPFCTKCDKKRFFSFRRDSKTNYGEMVSFIMLN